MSVRGKLSIEEVALAFLIGVGFALMALAGLLGAGQGDLADSTSYGLLFWLGVFTLAMGIVLWLVIVRPWTQFDDINQPKDSGHHGDTGDH